MLLIVRIVHHRWFVPIFLVACCAVLVFLWLPGLRYPVVSDDITYMLLGKSFWEHGTYILNGEVHAKHLPLYAIVSYPLTTVVGPHLGMKLWSLLPGMMMLVLTFFLLRRLTSVGIAALATLALLTHHGVVLMTMLGSADLFYACFFLGALLAYTWADHDRRWYLLCGACIGLACLTRYNGVTLFPLVFVHAALLRRADLRSPLFWCGLALGVLTFSPWLIRNALVFGNPLHTEYAGELASREPSLVKLFLKDLRFYTNPFHNILPILLLTAIWGFVRFWKKQFLLTLGIGAACALGMVWWVQGMRFIVPAFPLMLGFAFLGLDDIIKKLPKPLVGCAIALSILFIPASQAAALCLYTYGQCNAAFDRTVGWLAPDMGLTPEGFYSASLARDYANTHLGTGATLALNGTFPELHITDGVYRKDLKIIEDDGRACPAYRITQQPLPKETIIFTTEEAPRTSVVLRKCKMSP